MLRIPSPKGEGFTDPQKGTLKHDPLGGHLFCFRGRRSDLIKIIWHDSQGACLFTKRLERGRFIWPSVAGEAVTISPAQLSYLLSGIDWRNPQETLRQRELDSILRLNLPKNLIHWLHEFEAG